MNKLSETVAVPALTGAIAVAEGMFLYPNDAYALPGIGVVSAPVGLGVSAAVGAAVGQVGGNYILPIIPGAIGKYANIEKRVANPIVCGAATYGIAKLAGNDNASGNVFAVGATSNVLASYAYDTFMK